jgi:hypothetical protein
MRLLVLLAPRLRSLWLLAGVFTIGTLLAGCGGRGHRPASALTDHEREVLDAYEKVRAGLAGDDARMAKSGASELVEVLKKSSASPSSPAVVGNAQALVDAKALDTMRMVFQPLSASLIPIAQGVEGYYIMTSPPGVGGDWIQRTPDVDNPYLGKVMRAAGSEKK